MTLFLFLLPPPPHTTFSMVHQCPHAHTIPQPTHHNHIQHISIATTIYPGASTHFHFFPRQAPHQPYSYSLHLEPAVRRGMCGVCNTPELWRGAAGLCARVCVCACAGPAESVHTYHIHTYTSAVFPLITYPVTPVPALSLSIYDHPL